MTTFATEFLGCKVSMTDAQQVRERLAADGHREVAADQAAVRVRQHLLRHGRGGGQVPQGRAPRGAHAPSGWS